MSENTIPTPPAEAGQTARQINTPQVGTVEPLPAPAPPPWAQAVVNATRTEREIELQGQLAAQAAELEAERQAKRKLETDAAYHADENFRLKQLLKPTPKPRRLGPFGIEYPD